MAVLIENLVTKGLQALDASSILCEANFELTDRAKRLADLIATAHKLQVAEPPESRTGVPRGASPRRQELRSGRSIKMHACAAIRPGNFAYSGGLGNCNVLPNFSVLRFRLLELGHLVWFLRPQLIPIPDRITRCAMSRPRRQAALQSFGSPRRPRLLPTPCLCGQKADPLQDSPMSASTRSGHQRGRKYDDGLECLPSLPRPDRGR